MIRKASLHPRRLAPTRLHGAIGRQQTIDAFIGSGGRGIRMVKRECASHSLRQFRHRSLKICGGQIRPPGIDGNQENRRSSGTGFGRRFRARPGAILGDLSRSNGRPQSREATNRR